MCLLLVILEQLVREGRITQPMAQGILAACKIATDGTLIDQDDFINECLGGRKEAFDGVRYLLEH